MCLSMYRNHLCPTSTCLANSYLPSKCSGHKPFSSLCYFSVSGIFLHLKMHLIMLKFEKKNNSFSSVLTALNTVSTTLICRWLTNECWMQIDLELRWGRNNKQNLHAPKDLSLLKHLSIYSLLIWAEKLNLHLKRNHFIEMNN